MNSRLKIKALLHDPPHKPLSLMNERIGHEAIGEEFIEMLLGEKMGKDFTSIKKADHIAAASDRYNFPFDWAEPNRFSANFLKNPVIIHPISGEKLDLVNLNQLDINSIKSSLSASIKKIADTSGDIDERYLLLWRLLPDLVKELEEGDSSLEGLWDLLPADTRIPDHSIWQHQRIVSALAGAGAGTGHHKASLILFTVGPVQDFISAARKTKDLWAGSYMLSWLIWNAMKVICEKCGPDSILFPDLSEQPLVDFWLNNEKNIPLPIDFERLKTPTLPNRFFAVVPDDDADQLCKEAQKAMQRELRAIGEFAKMKSGLNSNPHFDNDAFDKQLQNFIEVYYGILPLPEIEQKNSGTRMKPKWEPSFKEAFAKEYKGLLDWIDQSHEPSIKKNQILDAFDEGNFKTNIGTLYGRFYELLEKTVGSRKAVRNFSPVTETGYRCTLIPRLAALTPKSDGVPSTRHFREFWSDIIDNCGYEINSGERLSSIAFSKRYFGAYLQEKLSGNGENSFLNIFPSTHSFAAADYKLDVLYNLLNEKNNSLLVDALNRFTDAVVKLEKISKISKVYDLQFFEQPLRKISRITAQRKNQLPDNLDIISFNKLSGEWFFQESFKKVITDYSNIELEDRKKLLSAMQEAEDSLLLLLSHTDKKGIQRPSKYYAVIHFDGDHMGRWLSGEKSPNFKSMLHPDILREATAGGDHPQFEAWEKLISTELNRPLAPSIHSSLSKALNQFSLHLAPRIVEKQHLGKLIYSGGDDVFAMLSFRDAISCAETLRAAFSGFIVEEKDTEKEEWVFVVHWDVESSRDDRTIIKSTRSGYVHVQTGWDEMDKRKPVKKILSTMGRNATASAGISYVHYLHPLRQAVADVKMAEKYAKEKVGRDGFAINIVKRSGENSLTGGKWVHPIQSRNDSDSDDKKRIVEEYLNPIIRDVGMGLISQKFIVDLRSEMDGLSILEPEDVILEARRLFLRHSEGYKRIANEQQSWKKLAEIRFKSSLEPLFLNLETIIPEKESGGNRHERYEILLRLIEASFYLGKGGGR